MKQITRMSERWIDSGEVANILGYKSTRTIRRLEKQLGLKNVAPVGCHPRYKLSSVMDIKEQGVNK